MKRNPFWLAILVLAIILIGGVIGYEFGYFMAKLNVPVACPATQADAEALFGDVGQIWRPDPRGWRVGPFADARRALIPAGYTAVRLEEGWEPYVWTIQDFDHGLDFAAGQSLLIICP